jgi:hypothetical protein
VNSKSAVRSLASLRDASSARVLNLLAVQRLHGTEDDYRKKPFFDSPVLNASILLKHRLRPDDHFMFVEAMTNATKVVLPLDKSDLRLGGTSFFYGQRGFTDFMREMCHYNGANMDRDLKTLEILNDLPSLDPFLIHERFQMEGIEVADCYFELSASDKSRMQNFVTNEISTLIMLACRTEKIATTRTQELSSSARLSSAILAVGAEDQLEPLRTSLMLEGNEFRKGIFSWRGFLYYKWRFLDLMPKVDRVMREIIDLPVTRGDRSDDMEMARQCKRKLVRQISVINSSVSQLIGVYDQKYGQLTQGSDARAFREFLLNAPHLFVELGEKFGGLAHIESFWRFRFPKKRSTPMRADEALPLFADFMLSVGLSTDGIDVAA